MTDLFSVPGISGGATAAETGSKAGAKKHGGGPKTPEGKARASANSMKLGMRSKVLLPADLVATFEAYRADLERQFQPRTPREAFLVREMARGMALLDRS